jgi:hypothetical protein
LIFLSLSILFSGKRIYCSAREKNMPQLLSFSQPMPSGHSSREIVVAFSISVIIHLFAALLLWVVAIDRISVEPASPSIDTPLIVSLTSLPSTSHDGFDSKSEAEIVVKSIAPEVPATKTPEVNPSATDPTSSFNMDALYRMEWNFGKIPEFQTEAVDEILIQGVHGSEAPGGNSLADYLTPSHGLESVKRFEQVFGEISESELQRKKIEWRVDYIKKYEASLPPDCSTYYGSGGLLAIPIIIKDVITHNNKVCMW